MKTTSSLRALTRLPLVALAFISVCSWSSAACFAPPAGVVAWWQLDGNASDIVGTNTGTVLGGAAFASGEVGQSLTFDGIDDEVDIASSASLNVGTGAGFTIELWVNPSETASAHPLVEWNNRHDSLGLHFWISTFGQGTLDANLIDTSATSHSFSSSPGVILPNAWQHVALTYAKASGTATLYRNGANIAQQNFGALNIETSLELFLGRRVSVGGSQYYYQGRMDEVTLYNRALAQTDVQSIFNAGTGGKCNSTGPVIVPPQYTNQNGAGASSTLSSAIRIQQIYDSSLFSAAPILIREIRWRPSTQYGATVYNTVP